ncbi:MAG: polysaccharide deacetylase family protein [Bacteroidota bacterium]|nr:polysaccharide deacetylase family protein [Bacteroidota bacterium]
MKIITLTSILILTSCICLSQPKISFTFDDGDTNEIAGYPSEKWNQMILDNLKDNNITSAFFIRGNGFDNEKGRQIIQAWNDAGHMISNHTYSHRNYDAVLFEDFKNDFLINDSLINKYSNFTKLFRFPFLKEGETKLKIEQFREFLKEHSYKNGYVTIDASDWYINARLIKKLKADSSYLTDEFCKYYLEHLYDRASYYEKLAYEMTGRNINHTILLHHNLTSALFLGNLIKMFKSRGWIILNAKEAYTDSIFDSQPDNVPEGESLIWALAKQSGKYDSILRYPAEDSEYEKDKMDKLGL